jgi:predicted Zn-dependent protease
MLRRLLVLTVVLMGLATAPQGVALSEKKEREIGAKMHAEILKQTPAYADPALQDYIDNIGQRLAAASERPDLEWTFTLLDNPTINAFATPGGYVYLNSGMLAYLNNEAQLAAVLGHEVAHIAKHHASRQNRVGTASNILSTIAAVAAGVYTGSGSVAGVTKDIGSGFGAAVVRGYGRDHELEADEFGARYIKAEGYDPNAMLEVIGILKDHDSFSRIKAKKTGKKVQGYHGVFATHPRHDKRLQNLIADVGSAEAGQQVPVAIFRGKVNRLKYGNRGLRSLLDGTRYYHRSLDFTVAFPGGWQVTTRGSTVTAKEANNKALMQMRVKRAEPDLDAKAMLEKLSPKSAGTAGEVWENGELKGYSVQGSDGMRRAVILHRSRAFFFIAQSKDKALATFYDTLFNSSIRSFRALNEQEKHLVLAQKIQFIEAQPGQSYADLAADSSLRQFAEEELRLLNGDYPDGKLSAGDVVKIVR